MPCWADTPGQTKSSQVSLCMEKRYKFIIEFDSVCLFKREGCLSARWVVDLFRGSIMFNIMCETLVQRL